VSDFKIKSNLTNKPKLNSIPITELKLNKRYLEIVTDDGWRLPVKYNISPGYANELSSQLDTNTTNSETKSVSYNPNHRGDAVLKPRLTKWYNMIGELRFIISKHSAQIACSVAKELVDLMSRDTNNIVFNSSKLSKLRKPLIQTWSMNLNTRGTAVHAILKQDGLISSKKAENIKSFTFKNTLCTIVSDCGWDIIDDHNSVMKVRRQLKSTARKLNMTQIRTGTDIIYFTQAGANSSACKIMSRLATCNTNSGRVPMWDSAIQHCGLTPVRTPVQTSESNDSVNYHTDKAEKKKKQRPKKKKGGNPPPVESETEEEGPSTPAQSQKPRPMKLIQIHKWRLAQLNIADIRRHTEAKWRGLAQIMETHKLHGIALQELRVEDAALFTTAQHLYKGLTLLVQPCIQGEKGGNAGGLGFLVKIELVDQGLFSQLIAIKSQGFYGPEDLAYVDIKVGTSSIKWINVYIRSRPGSEMNSYEWNKVQSVCTLKGDKIVMGDINGSQVYSRPTKLWARSTE
jgi:hypothetical protein